MKLLSKKLGDMYVGVTRPNLGPTTKNINRDTTDGWFFHPYDGYFYGNGQYADDHASACKQGDRVGVLLDLEEGSLRFFKNGKVLGRRGMGYPAGSVTGPVVASLQMYFKSW
jgi:hypothetical protein